MGCRLQAFLPAWAAITDDAYVLSIIRGGFIVELSEPLPGGVVRLPTPRMPPHIRAGLATEITPLISKGVIEPTADFPRLCLSPIFLVPKRSGNFKRINRYIGSVHFRMETLASILPYPGDWTVSIDLKDAYHHVPIAAASRDLLGFTFNGGVYRFKALPFGLKPAPRLFTRLVGCVAAFLRQRGLQICCYLDDWLLVASSLPPPPPPAPATATPGPPVTDSAGPRFPYQLGQVGTNFPDSVPDYRYPPAAGAAQPEEDRHNRGGGPTTPWPTASPGQDMASVPRLSLEPSRRPSGLPTAHAPSPTAFSQELSTGPGRISAIPKPFSYGAVISLWIAQLMNRFIPSIHHITQRIVRGAIGKALRCGTEVWGFDSTHGQKNFCPFFSIAEWFGNRKYAAGTPYPDGSPCPRRSASSGGGAVRNSCVRATH